MIIQKTKEEIELIRESALIVSKTLGMLAPHIKTGVTTLELDKMAEKEGNGKHYLLTIATGADEAYVKNTELGEIHKYIDFLNIMTYSFGKLFSKEGIIDKKFHRWLLDAFDQRIIGDYGVNAEGSGDMYFKGSNLLNTFRSIYDDDELWWNTLRDYTKTFKHQTISTQDTEDFFNKATKVDLQPVFDQYLRHAALPVLQLQQGDDFIRYRWKTDVINFSMPVDVIIDEEEIRFNATSEWQSYETGEELDELSINDLEFYIETEILK